MLRSPLTSTTTASPSLGTRLRSTVIRLPSKMPTSMALSPATVMMKVAGAFWMSTRDRSIGWSR
ncbi:hypothetical protein AXW83_06340 [Bosea sp. PAMC 26642]|nr:hypothetical protein AXW83_06340 [Bosea sp. PAMC 26642]